MGSTRKKDSSKKGPPPKPRGRLTGKRSKKKYANDKKRLLEAVSRQDNPMSLREACTTFDVPYRTAQDLVYGKLQPKNAELVKNGVPVSLGRPEYLKSEEKIKLVQYMNDAIDKGFSITAAEVQSLAFSFAQASERPSMKWVYKFIRKHFDTERRVQMDGKRQKAERMYVTIADWIAKLEIFISSVKPDGMLSCDETAFERKKETVSRSKAVVQKGDKKASVPTVSSIRDGSFTKITMLSTISSTGDSLSPAFCLQAASLPMEASGIPSGVLVGARESGQFDKTLFRNYVFREVIPYKKKKGWNKVLFFMDEASVHCDNLTIAILKLNGIYPVVFPSNRTHRCQALDTQFFGGLKSSFRSSLDGHISPAKWECMTHIVNTVQACALETTTCNIVFEAFQNEGFWPYDADYLLARFCHPSVLERGQEAVKFLREKYHGVYGNRSLSMTELHALMPRMFPDAEVTVDCTQRVEGEGREFKINKGPKTLVSKALFTGKEIIDHLAGLGPSTARCTQEETPASPATSISLTNHMSFDSRV